LREDLRNVAHGTARWNMVNPEWVYRE
jgi:hypothetical protein